MLLCAGCGRPLSEWAGRCPACGRPTDDARAARPLHPRRRPAVVLAALVTVLLLAGAVGLAVRSDRSNGPVLPASPRLPGRVVALGPEGAVAADPHGGHRRRLPVVRFVPGQAGVAVDSRGQVVTTSLGVEDPPAPALSLADGGRAVLARTGGGLAVVPLSGGRPVPLGGGVDQAAGDPGSLGAWVGVGPPGGPDRDIELRGGATRVVVTAAQIDRDTATAPDLPVRLTVFPDQAGDKVAVTASSGLGTDAGLVVLDRTGRLLGAIGPASGPIAGTPVYWSPDGDRLAYTTFDSDGTALALVDRNLGVTTQGFQPDTLVTGCAWSPDSAWILCQATSPYTSDWVLAGGAAIYSFPAAGRPAAWLP